MLSNFDEWAHLASAIAAIAAPLMALLGVGLGYVLHSRHELRQRAIAMKEDLFVTVMAHRDHADHPEFIKALNTAQVVFKDNTEVAKATRDLRNFFMAGGGSSERETRAKVGALLLQMANALGYKDIDESDVTEAFTRGVGYRIEEPTTKTRAKS